MAGLNIVEWTPDQVAEWLTGLGPKLSRYIPTFKERGLDGAKLLMLRCDDLEYLGMHTIGHQELLLEAVDHLRNFHYEVSRECVQQLALRVSVVATALARALRHRVDSRLETQTLADVARTVHAVKPLVCWLDRWPLVGAGSGGAGVALGERKAALLKLSLEAATCAQRDRFADQPARAVAAAAAATAATADYIIQEVSDPLILQPAAVEAVVVRQRGRPLGFGVVPSFCGHHQLADIRFGSPAHASGALHQGDEIVQVGGQCVIGWCGEAVLAACTRCGPELALRVRRRGGRAPPALATPQLHRLHRPQRFPHHIMHADINFHRYVPLRSRSPPPVEKDEVELQPEEDKTVEGVEEAPRTSWAASSSDESEPLSPPASPTHLHLDHTRMYPPKPRLTVQRRHSVSCASPTHKRPPQPIEQFWQELKERKWGAAGSTAASPAPPHDDVSLYARDKAVSCSTGLELSPRPRTCLGVVGDRSPAPRTPHPPDDPSERNRGKLDKSHSTPAYDFDTTIDEPGSLVAQIIPESPTTPTDSPTILVHSAEKADQILDFKKSSSQIGEAILQQQSRKPDDSSHRKPVSVERDHGKTDVDLHNDEDVVLRRDDPFENKLQKSQESVNKLDLDVGGTGERDESTTEKILETINIAMMQHRRRSILDGRGASGEEHHEDSPEEQKPVPANRYVQSRVPSTPSQTPVRPSRGDTPPSPPPRPTPRLLHTSPSSDPLLRPRPSSPLVSPPLEINPRPLPVSPLVLPPSENRLLPITPLASPPTEPPVFPVLRAVPRPVERSEPTSPLKPIRPLDGNQISVPLRHITKHEIRVIPCERRELPAINSAPGEAGGVPSPAPDAPTRGVALSPTSAVRGIFPTSKNRSLKKKSSILAKRRCVSARALAARAASGWVWQRVRAKGAAQPRWASRHLLLAHNLLYAYKTPECSKADCMIYLEGFTTCAAAEVKSRAHAFKVYHTGTAFYFACDSRDAMLTWIQLIHRATLLPSLATQMDVSKQFSETDYSETESENESPEKRSEREKEKEKEKDKDKDKSKFGSLKKFAHRVQRSESHEDVRHSSTSLDRKYLRFFSRNKSKDETKNTKGKPTNVPVPTEHYRSYRRVPTTGATQTTPLGSPLTSGAYPSGPPPPSREERAPKIPKPINYIHASNPNLLDFEKSDFVTKPTLQVPKPKPKQPENLVGFVTLEQFMLKKQEEERRHLYTDRVLLGVQRDRGREREHKTGKRAALDLQKRLDRIVPDVIYGEVCSPHEIPVPVLELQQRHLPPAPAPAPAAPPPHPHPHRESKPISIKGKDGYEKIVYTDDLGATMSEKAKEAAADVDPALLGYETIFGDDAPRDEGSGARRATPPLVPDRWRDSLRRNDKVHTASSGESSPGGPAPSLKSAAQYTPLPHNPQNLHLALDSWSGGNGNGESSTSGGVSRLRLMFGGGRSAREAPRQWQPPASGAASQYPHLVCPPTFQPETYSLARLHPHRDRKEPDT